MEDKARVVAVKTLCDIETKNAYSNLKLNYYFKKYDLDGTDRAFATEILYGTIRWKKRIDYLIKKFSKIKIKKMPVWTLCSIRIAIYEIYFLSKVPDFASVNQAVEIVKLKEEKDVSFVNAILRNILRNKEEFYNIKIQNKIQRMSVEYSQQEWFVEKLIKDFGEKTAKIIMEKSNKSPKLNIRVNTLRTSRDKLKTLLESQGCNVEDGALKDSLKVKGLSSIEKNNEFINGDFSIQDESSMLACLCLDPKKGDKIIDICSAPGGKSTYMAELMDNSGEIKSFDIHEHKLKIIEEAANRLGITIIEAKLNDGTQLCNDYINYANKILVDVPCSGLGIIRKKPEIRWNMKEEDVVSLSKIQKSILENASKYVVENGELVYSTCTITKEENEDIIEEFLSKNNNFELVDISDIVPFNIETAKKGYVKLLPGVHDTDGFFIAKLRRKR